MPLRSYLVLFCVLIASTSAALAAPRDTVADESAVTRYERFSAMDFPALKAALEKAGWPASHVQAFVILEINRRLNPPEAPTAADFRPFVYWHTGPDAEPLAHLNTPERSAARSRRADAVRVQLEALFPSEEPEDSKLLRQWEEQRKWGAMPAEKRSAVADLLARVEKEREAFLQAHRDILTPEDDQHLDELAIRARADLAKILNPEELFDFDLRNSATAGRMRSELDSFQPTQEEFLAIFRLRHPLELKFAHLPPGHNPEIDRHRAEAEAAIEKALAKLLGPERYDDYRISLEPACQMLRFDGRAVRASAETVRRLYRTLVAAQAAMRKSDALPEAEKAAAQTKIKSDLHREFSGVLGDQGARQYLEEQSLNP